MLSQSGCFMWTGRAFHPDSYIVQRRERDVATRLSKFIDIEESNQSTPRVLRSNLIKEMSEDKRTTRTSGQFVDEEERTMWGLVDEEERTRTSEGGSRTTMGRAVRARTAPVNVEALQAAEVAERNPGRPSLLIIFCIFTLHGGIMGLEKISTTQCFLLQMGSLRQYFSRPSSSSSSLPKSSHHQPIWIIFVDTRSLFAKDLGDQCQKASGCRCCGGEIGSV